LTTVLILDNDPGFLFWLGTLLGESGYQSLPALNVVEALSLTQQFKVKIDLLIVDPLQTGVADFINSLRLSQGRVKVLAASDQQGIDLPVLNASIRKPDQFDENTLMGWISTVERLLAKEKLVD